MHETVIASGLIRCIEEKARTAQARRILSLRVSVGALSGVVPEALAFAFEAMSPGTLAEGARLELEPCPVRCYCAGCASEFVADSAVWRCPRCQQLSTEVRAGRDLLLTQLEVE
jgi:hydrogenase nickel incorporation protein HypA/HybF